MGFILHMEGKALEELGKKEAEAASQSSEVYQAFKDKEIKNSIEESKELGISDSASSATDSGGSDSSSSSSDSSEDGSSDDSTDFDMDGDDDVPSFDDEPEEEESKDEEPEEEEEEPEEEIDEDTELKTESLKSLSYLPQEDQQLRLEGLGDSFSSSFGSTWLGLSFVVSALATVGLQFVPYLLTGMFKIVLFTFAKTFKTLDNIFDYFSTTIQRYINRTEKQQETIKALKESLNDLVVKKAVLPEGARLETEIRFLESGNSNDLNRNVSEYTEFMNDKVSKLNQGILAEFKALKTISEARYLGKNFEALSFMEIKPESFGFTSPGNIINGEGVALQNFKAGDMIGNIGLLGKFPVGGFDNWNSVEKGYSASEINLEANLTNKTLETPVMELTELRQFLNNLELLAKASLQHQLFYEEIANQRSGVINSVKQLFVRLSEEKVKVSFKNSVALPLHLKSAFVSKVYMAGAMDIHDHTARVIANGLSFAAENLKLFKEQTK